MSSVYAIRAKKWGTNPFLAEWLSNAVVYCQSKEGKRAFEVWCVDEYGKEEAKAKLLECQKPPQRKNGLPVFGNFRLFNVAAIAGISDEAIQEYHIFTAQLTLCVPDRTRPAPKRRRGETSVEWLARRHDALLAGCKIPDIDWRIARAIAISEFDKARDTFEIWHSDIKVLLDVILARIPTTLVRPEIIGTPQERSHRIDHAFTSSLHGLTLSYMTWGQAVEVFEELDQRGLASTSSIERAYQKDSALMWRLVTCICNIDYLKGHLWERFTEVMSYCEYYRPCFKRYRVRPRIPCCAACSPLQQSGGSSRVELDRAYLKTRTGTPLDNLIVGTITTDATRNAAFFDNVLKCLGLDPNEATKFSTEAYQELGDIAIVDEFRLQMYESAFGQRLVQFAKSKDQHCREDPSFLPNTTFMDPAKLLWLERNSNDWTYARTISRSVGNSWLDVTNGIIMSGFFMRCIPWPSSPEREILPFMLDGMWFTVDSILWKCSTEFDRKGCMGTVGKKFGLFHPADPDRPSAMKVILQKVGAFLSERGQLRIEPNEIPRPPAASTPTQAAVKPTVAASGHAYVSETQHLRAKEKAKTRGTAVQVAETDTDAMSTVEEEEILPEVLPNDFKLGKKILKVFHRILQAPDMPEANESDDGPKMGQIRWGDFERAMKRIGFGIAQTAGSSVRFDPPAKLARPITFHRPHPDSTLTPNLLKWYVTSFSSLPFSVLDPSSFNHLTIFTRIGARLKRCYGWTSATFVRGAGDRDD
ncbi:hypothetical protein K438DRAFT_1590942 [Mycena galopus ATCC 62051]|nr:hypothetical protein K438DRAFT_1590942 [Mycena galopus ATCC 62051]